MKPVDIKSSTYINSSKEVNNEDPQLKIGYIVRMSKYINIFSKGYGLNWSEKFLWLEKLKTLCCGHKLLVILKEKKSFTKNKSKRV